MYDSFSPDELELRSVISETLIDVDEVKSVQTIQTGWTNITMDVQCKKNLNKIINHINTCRAF